MSLSPEYIQEKMFTDFSKAVKKFYEKEEDDYIKDFKEKMESGIINADDYESPRDLEPDINDFLKKQPERIETFIKNYVEELNNNIFDALKENYITQEEAEISFEMLKHFLIAAKIHVDSSN
jgi:gas vesicle protein